MAMTNCRECGTDVSDAASACPRCGVSAPAGSCTLVVNRPSLMNAIIGTEVYVDGNALGSLRPRGKLSMGVSPGVHTVEVRTSKGSAGSTSVTASGREVSVSVKLSALGKPKFS